MKFLVVGVSEEEEFTSIMTEEEIFRMMDMSDCVDIHIDLWKINGYGEALTECSFHGKWCCGWRDPQRMEICSDNGIEAVGYGTEH